MPLSQSALDLNIIGEFRGGAATPLGSQYYFNEARAFPALRLMERCPDLPSGESRFLVIVPGCHGDSRRFP